MSEGALTAGLSGEVATLDPDVDPGSPMPGCGQPCPRTVHGRVMTTAPRQAQASWWPDICPRHACADDMRSNPGYPYGLWSQDDDDNQYI